MKARRPRTFSSATSGAIGLGLVLATAGCGDGRTDSRSTGTAGTQVGGTLTVVGAEEPAGFNVKIPDKQSATNLAVMSALWRGAWIVRPDFQFALNTDLLTSAEMINTDPQTVVYKINPRAVWSDGAPVDADDFIYNWETARPGARDADGTPTQSVALPGGGDPIASVTGSDGGRTVTVVYKARNVQWKAGLLFNYLIPAHVARRVGFNSGFARFDPTLEVSNGPYKIGSFNPGRDLTLVRNERFWGAPATLDRVVFRFTGEEAGATALKSGEGDLLVGHAVPDLIAQLRQTRDITTRVTPTLSQEYVGFNLRNELLALPAVRKAFALAVDRMVDRDPTVNVVNSFLRSDRQPAYRDTSGGRYDRPDVAGAKRLLEEAGFSLGADGVYARDGKRLALRARTFPEFPHEAELQLVQAQVKQAGIELRIENAPDSVLGPQLSNGDFDVEVTLYGKNLFGSVNQFRPGNRWGYANPRPNELVAQSNLELDDAERQAILDEADRILWDDLPIVPLYQLPGLMAVRSTFVNVEPNPAAPGASPFWNLERWARKAGR